MKKSSPVNFKWMSECLHSIVRISGYYENEHREIISGIFKFTLRKQFESHPRQRPCSQEAILRERF